MKITYILFNNAVKNSSFYLRNCLLLWMTGREYETAYQEAKNEALQVNRFMTLTLNLFIENLSPAINRLSGVRWQPVWKNYGSWNSKSRWSPSFRYATFSCRKFVSVAQCSLFQVKVSVLQEEKRKLAAQLTDMKNKWTSRNVEVPKRDVGVGTLTSKLKDEIVQTEKWIQNVSNKLIQTLWQPKTESAIQTDPLRLEHVDVVRSNVHTQTINAEPSDYVPVPTNDAQSQTPAQVTCNVNVQTIAISAERKYVQTDPVIPERKQHTHSQTDQPVCERKHNIYVQTDNSLMASAPVVEKRYSGVPARKSIAIGDGAINDVLCDNCRSKRTRHVACSTDSVRPSSGVNVATQCFSPCMVSSVFIRLFYA